MSAGRAEPRGNPTSARAPFPRLFTALAAHAEQAANQPAIIAGQRTLDYGQLWARVSRTAAALVQLGAVPGSRIALLGHKTPEAVAAQLGIMRAGGTYVPLDPRAPLERSASLLRDAACGIMLHDGAEAGELGNRLASEGGVQALDFEHAYRTGCALPGGGEASLPARLAPDLVAYCMYTSGSTGRPKGVQIPHRALDAFFAAVHPLLEVGPADRCLNTSALHFDVSVVDLLYPLMRGATVHLSPAFPLPPLLVRLIERERITYLAAVGSTLNLLAEHTGGFAGRDLAALRRVMTGAEVLQPRTVQQWLAAAPRLVLVNGYGPTEATCLAIAEPISRREPGRTAAYPIGRPLPGTTALFLKADGTLDPDGPGEIVLAGPQLMAGYLDRPEEERRVLFERDGVRYYRTGDHGHRDADGTFHFHGRRDAEVKVRGYRVNLHEVQSVLESSKEVGRAFVGLAQDRRGAQILACAIALPDTPAQADAPAGQAGRCTPDGRARSTDALPELEPAVQQRLVALATAKLPPYMVPAEFRLLPRVPLLPSGKADAADVLRRLSIAVAPAPVREGRP